ncbi:MAG: winged helix-turn-helix transcriptional regulator [Deltaproteobacteria bacterium]|nr:winged helix-turn-helix transcriptional regulator [Deltaproteobacteria bacterium]
MEIEQLASIFKVLGESNRLAIVLALGKNSCSVTEIIKATGLSQTLVSFHLRTLRNSEIVKTNRNGPFIYYRLSEPAIIDILGQISKLFNFNYPDIGELKPAPNVNLREKL